MNCLGDDRARGVAAGLRMKKAKGEAVGGVKGWCGRRIE